MKEILTQEVPIAPRSYQQPIVDVAIDTILAGENGLVIQPTSTGKSTEAAFIAKKAIQVYRLKGLYLYNENEGLDQAREKFEQIFADERIISASFYGTDKDDDPERADIVFASYQSLNNHHEKWYTYFKQGHFGFILVNEAHHGQAVTYKEVIDFFHGPKIGFTATPEREDQKDILEIFDKIIAEISFEEAMLNGWMSPVRYLVKTSNLNKKKLKQMFQDVVGEGKKLSMKQVNENLFIDSLDREVFDEIYSYACIADSPKQTLIYCENIIHADRAYEQMKDDGKSVAVIHSKKSTSDNRDIMKAFRKNKIQFLLSVDKLNEDIDVPNVEIGVFLRCTDSKRIFFQQLGRPLRFVEGKIALILDFVANAERLVMVNDLARSIEEKRKELGLGQLERNTLTVSGKEFDIEFSTEEFQVIDIARAIEQRTGLRGIWPSEEELRKQVLLYFKGKKITCREYNKAILDNNFNWVMPSSRILQIYGKTFSEFFGKKRRDKNIQYLNEKELKAEVYKHFFEKKFTEKEYNTERKKFTNWPGSYSFSREYSKTFQELFRGRKKSEWIEAEDLKKEVLKFFPSNKFTKKEYEKIKKEKNFFKWPGADEFINVYSKNFLVFFTGRERGQFLNEVELRKEVLNHFKNKNFIQADYDAESGKFPYWPSSGNFRRIYSKPFAEFFKGKIRGSYLPLEKLIAEVYAYFKDSYFGQTKYNEAIKLNNFNWPYRSSFKKAYGKTFNEVFSRVVGKNKK